LGIIIIKLLLLLFEDREAIDT